MRSVWEIMLDEVGHRLDDELLPRMYAAIGLGTPTIRAELTELGLPFCDPLTGRTPDQSELDRSAEVLISRSARNAAAGGAVSGFAGALGIPPELAAALAQTLRLGQRLAVVYGIDTDTDRGRIILWRAIAAAFELSLPRQGAVDLRVRALPSIIAASLPEGQLSAPKLARALAGRVMVTLGRRSLKILPGMGAALGAYDGRKRIREQAARMLPVFRRAWQGTPQIEGPIVDAEELRS